MGEAHHYHHHHQQPPPTTSSRLGLRATGGEIVEVQGGHIVRSTGRKDRHSKVCTAKGPRDRRVRLSAHTAIQFYDVQDRLGYDRPSKAVDWLIKKAKSAIDELAELPAWKPTTGCSTSNLDANFDAEENQQLSMMDAIVEQNNNQRENNSNFLPPSMDSDSIADTIKSFFPMGAHSQAGSVTHSQAMHYQNFPVPSQDLRLSLQSLQDPMLLHQNQQAHHQSVQAQAQSQTQAQALFGYDGSAWSENQKMVSWNGGGDTGAFVFNSPPLLGQSQFFTQRGPLQSSNTPSVRAWMEPSPNDHHHHHQHYQTLPFHPSSISGIGFAPAGEYSGFRIPARIQGEEEEHGGISDRPSSASSDSRH